MSALMASIFCPVFLREVLSNIIMDFPFLLIIMSGFALYVFEVSVLT